MGLEFENCFRTSAFPEGSKDPNNRALGPKYHSYYAPILSRVIRSVISTY